MTNDRIDDATLAILADPANAYPADVRAAARELQAVRAANGWRPIASAPTDGTEIDLWLSIHASPRSMGWSDAFRVVDAYHRDGKWLHRDGLKEKELHADYITHWMPRPEAPT